MNDSRVDAQLRELQATVHLLTEANAKVAMARDGWHRQCIALANQAFWWQHRALTWKKFAKRMWGWHWFGRR